MSNNWHETLPNAFNFRVMQNYDPKTILKYSRKLRAIVKLCIASGVHAREPVDYA